MSAFSVSRVPIMFVSVSFLYIWFFSCCIVFLGVSTVIQESSKKKFNVADEIKMALAIWV